MSNLSDFFGGGGGSSYMPWWAFTSNTTWNVSLDGRVVVHVCGGGGGAARNDSRGATGGNGAGYSRKTIDVVSGQSYTIVVGAGGGAATTDYANGTNGGASSFSGNGHSMTANGGTGGRPDGSSPVAATASGGDLNVNGGRAGEVVTNQNGYRAATGGGSCGVLGVGYNSGSALNTSSGPSTGVISAGAGVGGQSNNVTYTSTSSFTTPNAGGSGGAATSSSAGPGLLLKSFANSNAWTFVTSWDGGATASFTPLIGGGANPNNGAGLFSGGCAGLSGATSSTLNGGLGGGGGGALATSGGLGGSGGNGIVIIEYIQSA